MSSARVLTVLQADRWFKRDFSLKTTRNPGTRRSKSARRVVPHTNPKRERGRWRHAARDLRHPSLTLRVSVGLFPRPGGDEREVSFIPVATCSPGAPTGCSGRERTSSRKNGNRHRNAPHTVGRGMDRRPQPPVSIQGGGDTSDRQHSPNRPPPPEPVACAGL